MRYASPRFFASTMSPPARPPRPVHRAEPAPPAPGDPERDPDLRLLDGFGFQCRTDCGLCCFARPLVDPSERAALVRLDPTIVLDDEEGWGHLRLQGDGGACVLLKDRRCSGHEARPSPCRSFPLHLHLGASAQVTAVLSCPGLRWPPPPIDPEASATPPRFEGFDGEIAWLRGRLDDPEIVGAWELAQEDLERAERRSGARGTATDLLLARRRLATGPPMPEAAQFPMDPGPELADGLETLPLFQDQRYGTTAIAEDGGALALLQLRAAGGVEDRIGEYARAEVVPRVDAEGQARLAWYLGLLARREVIADIVRTEWLDARRPTTLADYFERWLQDAGARVLERARLRATSEGRAAGRLSDGDIIAGIQATDAELLDRPRLGLTP